MGRISVRYKINDPKSIYKPGDAISGKMWVENRAKKEKKLKIVYIGLISSYYKDSYHFNNDMPTIKTLEKWVMDEQSSIRSGQTKQYDFDLTLPDDFGYPKDPNIKNWILGLGFVQQTGRELSLGSNKADGVFLINTKAVKVETVDEYGLNKTSKEEPGKAKFFWEEDE